MARVVVMSRGPGTMPFVDGALQLHVEVEGALAAEVALGRDAGFQRGAGVGHGSRHALAERLLQDLIVPQRLVVRVQEEMGVTLDEPGNERRARQLDALGVGRHGSAGRGSHGLDAPAADDDDPVPLRGVGRSVPDGVRHQNERARRGLLGREHRREEGGERQERQRLDRAHGHRRRGIEGMYMSPSWETPGTDRPAATSKGHRQSDPDHLPEVFMRRTRSMLASAATLVLLGMLPASVHAQSMDKAAAPAMGGMKDTSAMKHDGAMKGDDAMAKDAMSKDAMKDKGAMMEKESGTMKKQGAAKGKPAMKEKDAMAEPGKMK